MTAAFSSNMGLSGLTNFMTGSTGSSDLEADLQAGGDTLNIDDVLSLLPSTGNWDSSNNNPTNNNLGSTSTSGNFPASGSGPGSGPPKRSNSSPLNPVTHVSWSNIPGVNPPQPQQQRRPMPINIPPNRSVGPGGIIGGMKSPISPGFSPGGQRSPGFATGNPQRRSPGAFVGQMSPSPSGSIPGQRSPAGFSQQMSPMGSTQRSPAGGPLTGFPQSRTPTPGLMSPPPIGESTF